MVEQLGLRRARVGQAHTWREKLQPALLASGIAAPLVYLASDVLSGLRWEGYSFRDQTISELNAFGSPSRSLTIALGLVGYSFLTAFGVGVWKSAAARPTLRVTGAALATLGLVSLWAVPFWSMHVRGAETTFTDTMHLVGGGIAAALLFTAFGFASAAFGKRFRLYSLATVAIVLAFAGWTAQEGSLANNPDTPWLGVKERVWVYAYQLWIVVLALALLRTERRGREH